VNPGPGRRRLFRLTGSVAKRLGRPRSENNARRLFRPIGSVARRLGRPAERNQRVGSAVKQHLKPTSNSLYCASTV